jgi:hypothetical protein
MVVPVRRILSFTVALGNAGGIHASNLLDAMTRAAGTRIAGSAAPSNSRRINLSLAKLATSPRFPVRDTLEGSRAEATAVSSTRRIERRRHLETGLAAFEDQGCAECCESYEEMGSMAFMAGGMNSYLT